MPTEHYEVTYACPNHGFDVTAIDRTWCYLCLVNDSEWVRVEHVASRTEDTG